MNLEKFEQLTSISGEPFWRSNRLDHEGRPMSRRTWKCRECPGIVDPLSGPELFPEFPAGRELHFRKRPELLPAPGGLLMKGISKFLGFAAA